MAGRTSSIPHAYVLNSNRITSSRLSGMGDRVWNKSAGLASATALTTETTEIGPVDNLPSRPRSRNVLFSIIVLEAEVRRTSFTGRPSRSALTNDSQESTEDRFGRQEDDTWRSVRWVPW